MKKSLKIASLVALTAATLALPAAAQEAKGSMKCQPKTGMSKCGAKADAKCASKCGAKTANKAKCGANKCAANKCAPKCAPKN